MTRTEVPPVPATDEVRADFARVRAATLDLVRGLSAEDCAVQSMPDASPVKWHLAHTSWFFETFVLARDPGYLVFAPQFDVLFNSYYNAVGPQHPRPQRGLLTRPALDQVLAYRRHVDAAVDRALAADDSLASLVALGLQHEKQHQELVLTDLKHLFSVNPLQPAYANLAHRPHVAPPLRWVARRSGIVQIGAGTEGFSYDNERPRHQVLLADHELASRLTTNSEYLEFIEDGGYERPEFWLSDGWATAQRERWEAPLYWNLGSRQCFTLGGARALDPDEPVCHVSFYEADAFARWSGCRLPLEAEWETAASAVSADGNLFDPDRLHPRAAAGEDGVEQLFGDVWEWTASPYVAYPGYRAEDGALGEYNGKFMCNQMVLRGGSCVSPRDHVRATYRNFFPPHARWQFSGIRLAR